MRGCWRVLAAVFWLVVAVIVPQSDVAVILMVLGEVEGGCVALVLWLVHGRWRRRLGRRRSSTRCAGAGGLVTRRAARGRGKFCITIEMLSIPTATLCVAEVHALL